MLNTDQRPKSVAIEGMGDAPLVVVNMAEKLIATLIIKLVALGDGDAWSQNTHAGKRRIHLYCECRLLC